MLGVLLVAVLATALANVAIGSLPIPLVDALAIVARSVTGRSRDGFAIEYVATIESIRLPRAVLSMIVGAGLATAGAALQGIFRNPLADPALIGVSSGAAVGAVTAIVLGFNALGRFSLPMMAFAGALTVTMVVYRSARRDGRTEIVTLLLTGIAVNAIAASAIGFLIFRANDQQLRGIAFWQLGSLGGASWQIIGATVPFVMVGCGRTAAPRAPAHLLALGEREAAHLGVDTERMRGFVIVISAVVVGASVAAVGSVAFVGLVVPHLVRLVVGPTIASCSPPAPWAGRCCSVSPISLPAPSSRRRSCPSVSSPRRSAAASSCTCCGACAGSTAHGSDAPAPRPPSTGCVGRARGVVDCDRLP